MTETVEPETIEIIGELEVEDQLTEAVYNFNVSPKTGIKKLCEFYHVPSTPENMAHILHTTDGLMSEKIGEFLSDGKSESILLAYFKEMDLNMSFINAIRKFISGSLRLPGEAEQIDRIVHGFAKVYVLANPSVFANSDIAYILAFAIIMLNSDQHNPLMSKRMTAKEFISNIRGAISASDISDHTLQQMYDDIKENPLKFGEESKSEFLALSAPKLHGYLRRKTNKWNSRWKSHFFVLANSCLYYFKSDDPENKDNPIGMIQLVAVKVKICPDKPKRIIISSIESNTSLSYVRFTHQKPELLQDIHELFLEAPSARAAKKWYYRINHSIVCTGYSTNNNNNIDNEKAKELRMISSFSSSGIGNSISETSEHTE
ncbi:Cytohesin-3 [Tritrichomonas foetus]|uniref:Cytohesin-3 n=1 Tax=Tritrichomonas foetus TaxID=1144522 RepID=A0A1J4J9B4_9EUKA|nr:Cytohesin-3 [Tritrichomonas foetus]|eukprot:OHS94839.1 Cytohesin-3 [Tritrichomonas foetus]